MKNIFLLLSVLVFSFQIYCQTSESKPLSTKTVKHGEPGATDAIWDVQFSFNTMNAEEQGVETDGNYIYTCKWSPTANSYFNKYTKTGIKIDSFQIPGVTNIPNGGIHDLAYDGTYFYGTHGNSQIYVMDFVNHTLISTINTPVSGITHITYDPIASVDGGFWVGNLNNLYLISLTGNMILTVPSTGLTGMIGTAFDDYTTPGFPCLWIFNQDQTTSTNPYNLTSLHQFKIDSLTLTGVTHNAEDIPGYIAGTSSVNTLAGGLASSVNLVTGKFVLLGNIQQSPNRVFCYELCSGITFPFDIGIQSIFLPVSGPCLTSSEVVKVAIHNYGTQSVSNFPVCYKINGGALVWDMVNTTILPGTTLSFTFTHPADLSAAGTYNFTFSTAYPDDQNTFNNTLNTQVVNQLPTMIASLGNSNGCPSLTSVPITVQDINNISSILLSFYFDNGQMNYLGYANANPLLSGGTLLVNTLVNKVNISWFSISPITILNDTLLEITFSGNPGTSTVNWDLSIPGACSFTNPAGQQLCTTFNDGIVSIINCSDLTGTLSYANISNTPINNTEITMTQGGNIIYSQFTNSGGAFDFQYLAPSNSIHLIPNCTKPYGGANATDALMCLSHFVGSSLLSGLPLQAADVNASNSVNALDALFILRRFVGLISTYPAGDWVFENPNITIPSNDTVYQNIHGLCYGDVNASFVPGIKTEPSCVIRHNSTQSVLQDDEILIPVSIGIPATLGAISLILKVPENIEILDTRMALEGELLFNSEENEYRLGWFSLQPKVLNEGDVLFYLKVRQRNTTIEDWIAEDGSELAGPDGNSIKDAIVTIPRLIPEQSFCQLGQNIPNPFKESSTISFYLSEESRVRLVVTDLLGRDIQVLEDGIFPMGNHTTTIGSGQLRPGIYYYKIAAISTNEEYRMVRKMVME